MASGESGRKYCNSLALWVPICCRNAAAASTRGRIPIGGSPEARSFMFRMLGERIAHWRYYTSAALGLSRRPTTSKLFASTPTGLPAQIHFSEAWADAVMEPHTVRSRVVHVVGNRCMHEYISVLALRLMGVLSLHGFLLALAAQPPPQHAGECSVPDEKALCSGSGKVSMLVLVKEVDGLRFMVVSRTFSSSWEGARAPAHLPAS